MKGEGGGGEAGSGRVHVAFGEDRGGHKTRSKASARGGDQEGRKVVNGRFHGVC